MEEETSFIIILLNVSFGEERKRKPFTCLFSLDKEVSLNLTLVVSFLGLSTTLAIWGQGGTGQFFFFFLLVQCLMTCVC